VIAEGKQQFLDAIAEAYDDMTADTKDDPIVCVTYALTTHLGVTRTGYVTIDTADGFAMLYTARAAICIQADALTWNDSE